jgi:hypothetical protein
MKCMGLRRLRGGQFVSTLPTTLLPGRRQPSSKWTNCLWRISTVAVGVLTLSSTLVAQHYHDRPMEMTTTQALRPPLPGRQLRG